MKIYGKGVDGFCSEMNSLLPCNVLVHEAAVIVPPGAESAEKLKKEGEERIQQFQKTFSEEMKDGFKELREEMQRESKRKKS